MVSQGLAYSELLPPMSGGRRGKKHNRKSRHTRKYKKMSGGLGMAFGAIVKDALVPLSTIRIHKLFEYYIHNLKMLYYINNILWIYN